MITRSILVPLLLIALVTRESDAQRFSELAVGITTGNLSGAIPIEARSVQRADTAATAPRATPFVLAGAALGAVVGAMLAVAYNPCSSDPQPGFQCSSTDPATGALIGIAVGTAAGLVVWAVVKSSRAARAAKPSSDASP